MQHSADHFILISVETDIQLHEKEQICGCPNRLERLFRW